MYTHLFAFYIKSCQSRDSGIVAVQTSRDVDFFLHSASHRPPATYIFFSTAPAKDLPRPIFFSTAPATERPDLPRRRYFSPQRQPQRATVLPASALPSPRPPAT
eukprot:g16792.t1